MRAPGRWQLAAATVVLCAACSSGHTDGRPTATATAPKTGASTTAATTNVAMTVAVSSRLVRPTSATLLVVSYSRSGQPSLAVLDVDHATTAPVPLPHGLGAYMDHFQLVSRPAGLVLVGSLDTGAGHGPAPVYWYRTTAAPPTTIGQASVIFPSAHPDEAWLTSDLATGIGPPTVHLDEVDATGTHTATTILRAPSGSVITDVAAVDSGFVVGTAPANGVTPGRYDLYDLDGRATVPLGAGSLIATRGPLAVFSADGHLKITNVVTGHQRQLPATVDSGDHASISPDGTRLVMQLPSTSAAGGDGHVAIVDLSTGEVTVGPPTGYIPPVWDGSSSDVLFIEPDGQLDVWQVPEHTLVRLGNPLADAVAIQTLDTAKPSEPAA